MVRAQRQFVLAHVDHSYFATLTAFHLFIAYHLSARNDRHQLNDVLGLQMYVLGDECAITGSQDCLGVQAPFLDRVPHGDISRYFPFFVAIDNLGHSKQ